jgi:tetratricopeptide (TPR) repeat protein
MLRFDGDHVNWVLVVILVAMALLLAMVSTAGYGAVDIRSPQQADSQVAARADSVKLFWQVSSQDRKDVAAPSHVWYIARELYQAGRVEEAREMFNTVLARYPLDPGARMWAGMAAFRTGDQAMAIRHWQAMACDQAPVTEYGVWPALALAAAQLESGRPDRAARLIVPLERGDYGIEFAEHPVVSFYAALVYEQLAVSSPKYRDAVEESLAETYSPALASSDGSLIVSPNSRSWLIFLSKRALQRTIRGARSFDWAAPVVPQSAMVEPSFAPTVAEMLECLGSADFASQARRKLRALELYQSPPNRRPEIFDDPELIKRGRFIA